MTETSKPRYPEIDLLRTVAIAMMVLYHLLFDLSVFYGYEINIATGGWKLFAQATATLFLLLVGISASIASPSWGKSVRRFFRIGGAALLVTAATYLIDSDTYVRFGVLHLIALSTLLLPFFLRCKSLNVIIGIIIILAGNAVTGTHTDTSFLIPVGFTPQDFRSVDWFPLLPWFGVILIGTSLGHLLYMRHITWRRKLPLMNTLPTILTFPGKHSLLLYIIHQPILLGILYAVLGPWG